MSTGRLSQLVTTLNGHPVYTPQSALTDGHHVEDGADDRHEEDGAEVVEEEPVGHEVAGVQDDGRQHEQEERVRRQRRRHLGSVSGS